MSFSCLNNNKYKIKIMKVLSNNGAQPFTGIKKSVHNRFYRLSFESGDVLECTVNHIFETLDGPITAKKLRPGNEIQRSDGSMTFLKNKTLVRKKFVAFDLVDVGTNSLYFTNNILSHNCSFLGSSNTLISAGKLQQLVYLEPEVEQQHLKIYEQPKPGHSYVATVDTGAGLSQDYSVINIIDVTEAPYKQVFVYKNNEIDPTSFSIVVNSIGRKYNYASLVVESNNDGKIVTNELWEMEYENMINTRTENGDNIVKSGKRSQPGIMMTKLTKRIGCSKLKELIESEVLVIVDVDTITELGTFAQMKGSYGAENGKHDDIVMCLVMFAWFASTKYFEDVTGKNTSSIVKETRSDDDLHTLLGFVGGDDNYEESSSSYMSW